MIEPGIHVRPDVDFLARVQKICGKGSVHFREPIHTPPEEPTPRKTRNITRK